MALKNQIPQNSQKIASDKLRCVYTAGGEEVTLTPDFVVKYLVSGDPSAVTIQEIVMFMNLCKYNHLNPFLREAYLIKYGNQPATIVTGKSALEKRAFRNERYRGFKAGIIVLTPNGEVQNRTGTFHMENENIVGGWCDVFVNGLEKVSVTVSMAEYVGKRKDGTVNQQWATKPATMIRKVAKMQALREAFPEDFGGMYTAEETGFSEPESSFIEMPETSENASSAAPPKQSEPTPPEMPSVPESKADAPDEFAMIMEGFEA